MNLTQVCRYLLLTVNTILMLLGLGLLAGGAYIYVAGAQYNITVTVAIGVMVCGGGIFLLSFVGCFGAMWEKKVLLYIVSGFPSSASWHLLLLLTILASNPSLFPLFFLFSLFSLAFVISTL